MNPRAVREIERVLCREKETCFRLEREWRYALQRKYLAEAREQKCWRAIVEFRRRAGHLLTAREQQVHSFLLKGLGDKQIATQLGISLSTAKLHASQVFRKLKISGRLELLSEMLGTRK